MEKQQIISKLKTIFHDLFGEQESFNEDISSADVNKWDSLHHVIFISRIENDFAIKFDLEEMLELKNIGDICRFIMKKV